MIRRLPLFLAVIFAATGFAQLTPPNHYGSASGFGSVLYPGVGHAPLPPRLPGASITNPGYASRLGATVRGYPTYTGVTRGAAHPSHSRQVIVPVPIIVGNGFYGYGNGYYPYDQNAAPNGYDPTAAQQQQPVTPPVVIINQSYRPETANPAMHDYPEALQRYDAPVHPMPDPNDAAPARTAFDDSKPTIYLIAFKDHTILPALAYWIEGDTLNYITQQGTPNRASLTLIDRDFSKQLNRERNVEFSLP